MRFSGKIVALLLSLIVIFIAGIVFLNKIKTISVQDKTDEFETIMVMDSIKVYTNYYGIPHIVANSEHDMFFAIGYVQASERLWQMDIMRRAGKGRLAELFGRKALPVDKFMRTLELESTSKNIYKQVSKTTSTILQAYSDGVNEYIKRNKNKFSFEFGALNYFPEEWQPYESIMIGREMIFEMSSGFNLDMTFAEIADRIGKDKAATLIPGNPTDVPYIMDEKLIKKYSLNPLPALPDTIAKKKDTVVPATALNSLRETLEYCRAYLGIKGSSLGSNSWAVKNRKPNGKQSAVLANDPHLSLGLPAKWLQMKATGPGINITGLTIPGIPLFIVGRNDYSSWGITNVMADDCDLFIERLDKKGESYFGIDSVKKKVKFREDTIKIKGEADYVYYFRSTERSPIISDVHPLNYGSAGFKSKNENPDDKYLKSYVITYKWIGKEFSDEIFALYKMNTAKNWNEFVAGANYWGGPALNFTYCDNAGNVGVAPSGMIPKRESQCSPNFPNISWQKDKSWSGFYKAYELPRLYNPEKNFVASANNVTSRNLPFFVTNYWEPSSRAERIEESIALTEEYTVRDAQYMQIDYLSAYARTQMKTLTPIFYKYEYLFSAKEKQAFNSLKNWDYIMTQNSPAASIFNVMLERIMKNTWEDELGERLYKSYVSNSGICQRKIAELLLDNDNKWFDDVKSPNFEQRDYIVIKSFKDAVGELNEFFKNETVHSWRYGAIHKLTLNHLFSNNELLKPTVTIGPFEMGGNSTTINNSEFRFGESRDVVVGASMRFIADMSDSVVYSSLPGGESGDPLNPNYSNQAQIWLNGGYIQIPISRNPGKDYKLAIVIAPK